MFLLEVENEVALKFPDHRDAGELFKAVDTDRRYLREWLPWVDSMKNEEDYVPVIEMWLKQYAANDGFQAAILHKGAIAGMAGFLSIDWNNRKTAIGYWLSEDRQGKGIMTNVCRKLTDLAFVHYGLNRVEIQCGTDNLKSRAIPERLGYTKEGVVRDGEFLYDHFHDLAQYSMTRKDWEQHNKEGS
ncbi:GNAT family N-acetyltransferase [Bacillus marinisedimentorum]|uniref:GNAT family N-acetyltransferase n=1 Tax=Bacillus marinisedimentorum TaxID=1821260 RepID=UPI0008721C0B|nr:GNAT family protein [Bacillus marinisedimentorum]